MAAVDRYNQSISSTAGGVLHIDGSGTVCTLTNQNGTTVKVFRDEDPITSTVLPNGETRHTFHFADGTEYHIDTNGIRSVAFDGNVLVVTQDNGTITRSGDLTGPAGETGPGFDMVTDNGDGTFTFRGINGASSFTTPDLAGRDGYGITVASDPTQDGVRVTITNEDPAVDPVRFEIENGADGRAGFDVNVQASRNSHNNGTTLTITNDDPTVGQIEVNVPDGEAITNADINPAGDLILTFENYLDPANPVVRTVNVGAVGGSGGGGTSLEDVVTLYDASVEYEAGHYVTDGVRRYRSLVTNNMGQSLPAEGDDNSFWEYIGRVSEQSYDGTAGAVTDINSGNAIRTSYLPTATLQGLIDAGTTEPNVHYIPNDVAIFSNVAAGTGLTEAIGDGRYAMLSHTHVASDITNFDTAVAANTTVSANSNKISLPTPGVPGADPDTNPSANAGQVAVVQNDGSFALEAQSGGVTGLTATAAELNILDGATVTTAELNTLSGITSTTAELNVLNGIPSGLTATEVGFLDGVTSAIQTQLNNKAETSVTDALRTDLEGAVTTTTPTSGFGIDSATATTRVVGSIAYFSIEVNWLGTNGNTVGPLTFNHTLTDFTANNCGPIRAVVTDATTGDNLLVDTTIADTTFTFFHRDGSNVTPLETQGTTTIVNGYFTIT